MKLEQSTCFAYMWKRLLIRAFRRLSPNTHIEAHIHTQGIWFYVSMTLHCFPKETEIYSCLHYTTHVYNLTGHPDVRVIINWLFSTSKLEENCLFSMYEKIPNYRIDCKPVGNRVMAWDQIDNNHPLQRTVKVHWPIHMSLGPNELKLQENKYVFSV